MVSKILFKLIELLFRHWLSLLSTNFANENRKNVIGRFFVSTKFKKVRRMADDFSFTRRVKFVDCSFLNYERTTFAINCFRMMKAVIRCTHRLNWWMKIRLRFANSAFPLFFLSFVRSLFDFVSNSRRVSTRSTWNFGSFDGFHRSLYNYIYLSNIRKSEKKFAILRTTVIPQKFLFYRNILLQSSHIEYQNNYNFFLFSASIGKYLKFL